MLNKKNKCNSSIIKLVLFIFLMACIIIGLITYIRKDAEKEISEIPETQEEVKKEPEVKVLKLEKAWVMSNTEENLVVWYKKRTIRFPYTPEVYDGSEEIVDLTFHDGVLAEAKVYQDKVTGKLLEVGEESITLEEEGTFALSENLQVYKLYGKKETYTKKDLRIGYSFTDFILDGDTVIAALVIREESMENIRVAVRTQDFAGLYHEAVSFTPNCDYTIYAGKEHKEFGAGEKVELKKDDDIFKGNRIKIVPKNLSGRITFDSVTRGAGKPSYAGSIELTATKDGIVVINELPLEEYLYGVVPSEMPAGYPLEALKAQAISARTYAYKNIQNAGLPNLGAHVDDSVNYQVYNNIKQDDRTTKAVRETSGQLLMYQGKLAQIYYYSTSCGFGTDLTAWGQKENVARYLKAKGSSKSVLEESRKMWSEQAETTIETTIEANATPGVEIAEQMINEDTFETMIRSKNSDDFEAELDFYRWNYDSNLNVELLTERLQERFEANNGRVLTRQKNGSYVSKKIEDLGEILDIEITKRSKGGAACEMVIYGSKQTVKVITEYNVRYILLNEKKEVTKQNGQSAKMPTLLPSSFLMIETIKEDQGETSVVDGNSEKEGEETKEEIKKEMEKKQESVVTAIRVYGGGYGHGIGMSQNGAKVMGEAGYSCEDILRFYYDSVEVVKVN